MDEHDRDQLLTFVKATEEDMQLALRHVPEPDMRELADAAWADLRVRSEFSRLGSAISSREFDERLDGAGLSGPQLAFKLAVIDRRREDAWAAERSPEAPEEPDVGQDLPPERRSRRGRLLRRAIAKLLDVIDTVLDSLVGALHGVGELIKELKQQLEKWLAD